MEKSAGAAGSDERGKQRQNGAHHAMQLDSRVGLKANRPLALFLVSLQGFATQ
jgi:hypothetical protein